MAENMIKFLRGNVASLPQTATEGALYFTKDEGVYLGLADGSYHRYGDFIQVNAVADLPVAGAHVNCMYYCVAENILAKWDGAQWVQINKQKTLAELGGVAKSAYDTKMTALEKADTDNATAISNLKTLVGTIPEGYEESNVIAYVNKKAQETLDAASGGSTESAASVKAALDAYKTENNPKVTAAKTAADNAQKAAEAAQATADSKTTMAEVEAKDYATKTEAQGYANAKDTAIAEAKKAGTDAQAAVDTLSEKVGTVAEGKTVVKMIEEAQAAATYDDKPLKGRVKAIEDDYLKAADKTALQSAIDTEKGRMDAFMASAEIGDAAIDTLKELQDYIASDKTAATTLTTKVGALETTVGKAAEGENPATGLVKSVADNAAAITTERARAEGVEATLTEADTTNLKAAKDYADEKITGLGIGDYAKKADLDSHTGDTVAHITADERTKWNAAEGKAHEHANKDLLDTYTQTEENLADAVSKKHSHSFVEAELNKIKDGDVANWNAAEQNAKDYADGLAKNYDKAGAATTAETNAKAHAESLLVWGEF